MYVMGPASSTRDGARLRLATAHLGTLRELNLPRAFNLQGSTSMQATHTQWQGCIPVVPSSERPSPVKAGTGNRGPGKNYVETRRQKIRFPPICTPLPLAAHQGRFSPNMGKNPPIGQTSFCQKPVAQSPTRFGPLLRMPSPARPFLGPSPFAPASPAWAAGQSLFCGGGTKCR